MSENLLKERLQQKCFPVKMKKYEKKNEQKNMKTKKCEKSFVLSSN